MSTEPQQRPGAGKNVDPEMESWSAVEGELNKHDQQMVKDYAEDVDNLLVFAGLFSAVLTAFLVESYQMLQEDNEETSKRLLRRISTQLESFSLSPSFVNATTLGSLPPDDFTPTRAALWINALWFLSLIFSLAAAFFGIRVRQWLREYMQWSAALAHPRDNVHLRQIRYTDFETWRVFGSIAIIPGLLELALVLFVSGIVIFLWTIDPTIAVVITVAVSIFLAIASTVTVLPALLKRCPYKSPTAWVFVLLYDAGPNALTFARDLWKEYKSYRSNPWMLPDGLPRWTGRQGSYLRAAWRNTIYGHDRARTWRERDFEGGYVRASRASRYSLAEDLANTNKMDTQDNRFLIESEKYGTVLFRISEVRWLAGALGWVMEYSPSSDIHSHVIRCTQYMHTPPTLNPNYSIHQWIRYLADLYALERMSGSDTHRPWSAGFSSSPKGVTALCAKLRLEILRECDVTNDIAKFPQPISRTISTYTTEWLHTKEEVNRAILSTWANDLRQFLPRVLDDPHYRLFALDALAVLSLSWEYERGCRDTIIQCFNFCQDNASAILRALNKHGIRASIFELLSFSSSLDGFMFNQTGHIIEDPAHKADVFEITNPRSILNFACARGDAIDDLDDMQIFAKLVSQWQWGCHKFTVEDRIAIIREITRFSDAARRQGFLNCGNVDDLPWFGFADYRPDICFGLYEGAVLVHFRQLLNSLQLSHELGLLTGGITKVLPFLQRAAQTIPQDVCADEDLFEAWIWVCSLLEEGVDGGFGGEEVEHVFLVRAGSDSQDYSDTEVAGMYELEV